MPMRQYQMMCGALLQSWFWRKAAFIGEKVENAKAYLPSNQDFIAQEYC